MKQNLEHFSWKTRNTRWEKGKRAAGKGGKKKIKRKERRWEGKTFSFDKFLLTLTAAELVILV